MLTTSLYPRMWLQFIERAFFVISSLSSPHQLSLSVVLREISLTDLAETVAPNHMLASSVKELAVINSTFGLSSSSSSLWLYPRYWRLPSLWYLWEPLTAGLLWLFLLKSNFLGFWCYYRGIILSSVSRKDINAAVP